MAGEPEGEPEEVIDVEADAQASLADDVLRRFVQMLLFARRGNGTWSDESGLASFHVVLPNDDDEQWWVQVNDEPYFWTAPRLVRDVRQGEDIRPEDVHVEPIESPPIEPTRFITGVWNGVAWDLTLRLHRPDPGRHVHLDAGLEFAAVATASLERGQLRAFHENAFHAVEHLAKAELLSYSAAVPEVAESRTHGRLRGIYQLWAHLGNTEQRFAALLQELDEARGRVTYAVGVEGRDADRAAQQQMVLMEMVEWVAHVVAGGGHKQIKLYATTDITAGQMVSRDTTSIYPPRRG